MFHAAVLTWRGKDMQELIDKITHEGVHVGGGIVKLDSFLNHQVEPGLTLRMAVELCSQFQACGVDLVTKVVTAEVSGIPVALGVASTFGAELIYARKSRSALMTGTYYVAEAISRTQGAHTDLMVDRRFLGPDDCVLIIDDFLATGSTLSALVRLVRESQANLAGIGCVIEKPAEGGREVLSDVDAPILTLATIEFVGDHMKVY